jgi:hypothetical protein
MNSKVDNRAFSRQLMDWSDATKHPVEHGLLKVVAENASSPEGQAAWANIVHAMTGQFDKVTADITYNDQEPIRQGPLDEDTVGDIFQVVPVAKGVEIEFPIDFYQVTDRDKFWAYAIPDHGYLPQRYVHSSSVKIGTYRIGSTIDFWIRYIEQARWDILARGLEVYKNGYIKKINSDGWATLAAAAYYRNIVVSDDAAAPNQLTPRLLSLMQVFMKRNGGGNMTSGGFQLTDFYISPEAAASMRSWDLSLVPEVVREQMYAKKDGTSIANLFGIDIQEHEDLGIGQPLQQSWTLPAGEGGLGLVMPSGTRELVLGMDGRNTRQYAKMPVRNPGLETFPDNSSHTHRSQTIGYYGWMETGFATLDTGFLLLGSF